MSESASNLKDDASISFSGILMLFFSGLGAVIRMLIKFFVRNKWFLLSFFVFGAILGYVRYQMTDPLYKITMIVKSTELNGMTLGRMIENLNHLGRSGADSGLATELKIQKGLAGTLANIRARSINGEDLMKDTTQAANKNFLIEMMIIDNSRAGEIQAAFLDYMNNNEYLNKRKKDKALIYENNIIFIDGELRKLDSLKIEYNRFLNSGKSAGTFYNNAFNPADLYKSSSDLNREKNVFQEWLSQSRESIVKIDGVKPSPVPQSFQMPEQVFLFGLAFLFIGALILALAGLTRRP